MKRSKTQLLRSLAAVMLLGAGLASCSQDDLADNRQGEPLPPGEYPLILNAGGLEAVATPAQKSAPSTLGTVDGNWDGAIGQPVAVQVRNQSGKEIGRNTYKVEDVVDATTATLHSENPYYWQNKDDITVHALYPMETMPKHQETFPLSIDEWNAETLAKYDFLYAVRKISFDQRETENNLEFRHLMTKVVINLRHSDYLEAARNEGKEIKVVLNHDENGKFEISRENYMYEVAIATGLGKFITVSPSPKNKDVDFGSGQPEEAFASYTALAIPGPSNLFYIRIHVGETTYIYDPGGMRDFEANEIFSFNITVREQGLELSGATIAPWTEDEESDGGTATMPVR